jgi:hypothetical protein
MLHDSWTPYCVVFDEGKMGFITLIIPLYWYTSFIMKDYFQIMQNFNFQKPFQIS